MARNNWRITPSNPYVHIMEYQLPVEEFKDFKEKFGKDVVIQMKKEIYDISLLLVSNLLVSLERKYLKIMVSNAVQKAGWSRLWMYIIL